MCLCHKHRLDTKNEQQKTKGLTFSKASSSWLQRRKLAWNLNNPIFGKEKKHLPNLHEFGYPFVSFREKNVEISPSQSSTELKASAPSPFLVVFQPKNWQGVNMCKPVGKSLVFLDTHDASMGRTVHLPAFRLKIHKHQPNVGKYSSPMDASWVMF